MRGEAILPARIYKGVDELREIDGLIHVHAPISFEIATKTKPPQNNPLAIQIPRMISSTILSNVSMITLLP
jgi:uncharacterized protein involved in tellurium resistance